MIHKQFQHNTPEGGTDVQFNLVYEGQSVSVLTIQLHSNFESGLPNNAHLVYNPDAQKWQLCTYFFIEDKSKNHIQVREWLNSEIANDILNKIIEIKEQETPNFTK